MSRASERIGIELETLALRAVMREYVDLNEVLFGGALRRPVLCFGDARGSYGRWSLADRRLELSRSLLVDHGWGVLLEVLKHEMAHQYVHEVLGVVDEAEHGPIFRRVCDDRGIDARAAGLPQGADRTDEQARILERVAKLLALAQSPNVHEAELAMSTAQRLMLKYNIETVLSGPHTRHVFRHLGRASGRVSESERLLAALLGEHFFVAVIWIPVWRPLEARRGSVLEVCGTRENVEMAAYAHSFLSHTAERLWREYRRSNRIGNAGRRSYLAGVISGFRDKLDRERVQNQLQGLVWAGDPTLERYLRQRHPYVRTRRYSGGPKAEVFAQGRQAGQKIVLARGLAEAPSRAAPLLLGPR